jgi:hypothetical protein
VILAVVKPWGATLTPDGATARGSTVAASVVPIAPAVATPTPTPSAEDLLREHCLAPGGWRIFSIERWRNQTVRAWAATRTVSAAGPTDPAIPLIAVIAGGVPALGYCAPVVGPERPVAGATMAAWRLADDGATAERLVLERILPPIATILGGLYAPPVAGGSAAGAEDGWPTGHYVFDVDGHWFGAEVRLVQPAGDPSPGPSPP